MELVGCKEVELQQQEKAPKGFLSLTAEEKAATAVQVKRSLADPKAVSMLGQSVPVVVAEAESRRCHKEQEKRQAQSRAAVLQTRGQQGVAVGCRLQVEVGGDPEGEVGAQVCDPPVNLDWDFTAQRDADLRKREQSGRKCWVEGRDDRYRDQGHEGFWFQADTMDWVTEDDAVWERMQSGRKGKEGEAGAEDAGTGAEAGVLPAGRPRVLDGPDSVVVAGDTAEQGGSEEGVTGKLEGGVAAEGPHAHHQRGVPGMEGGCTGVHRGDGGASPSDWVQGEAGAEGGRGESSGDTQKR